MQEVNDILNNGIKKEVKCIDELFKNQMQPFYLFNDQAYFKYHKNQETNNLCDHPTLTTTYGLGAIIYEMLNCSIKKIIIDCSDYLAQDLGMGLLAGLGVDFKDRKNHSFIPTYLNFKDIYKADFTYFDQRINDVELVVLFKSQPSIITSQDYEFARALIDQHLTLKHPINHQINSGLGLILAYLNHVTFIEKEE